MKGEREGGRERGRESEGNEGRKMRESISYLSLSLSLFFFSLTYFSRCE